MSAIPESHLDLLQKPIVVTLATLMADGTPQLTPVWCSFDGTHIWVNTARGRVKDKNMAERKRVGVLYVDPANPYRYCEVRGEVTEITEVGADAHIDDLAEKYLGQRPYPFRRPGEVRVIFKIAPVKVTAFPT